MEPIYEKIDQLTMKKVVTQEVIIDLTDLSKKRRNAVEARDRFLAEAAAQQAIIDAIDVDLQEARKIGVSESVEIEQPFIEEGSPAPQNEEASV